MEEILIIEDDHNILKVMDLLLIRRGYNVKVAPNGIEGIELLRKNPNFRAVVTDIRMPGKNGNEVAKYVRENERIKNMPVIAVTGYPSWAEEELFDAIYQKPFNLRELIGIIDSLP